MVKATVTFAAGEYQQQVTVRVYRGALSFVSLPALWK